MVVRGTVGGALDLFDAVRADGFVGVCTFGRVNTTALAASNWTHILCPVPPAMTALGAVGAVPLTIVLRGGEVKQADAGHYSYYSLHAELQPLSPIGASRAGGAAVQMTLHVSPPLLCGAGGCSSLQLAELSHVHAALQLTCAFGPLSTPAVFDSASSPVVVSNAIALSFRCVAPRLPHWVSSAAEVSPYSELRVLFCAQGQSCLASPLAAHVLPARGVDASRVARWQGGANVAFTYFISSEQVAVAPPRGVTLAGSLNLTVTGRDLAPAVDFGTPRCVFVEVPADSCDIAFAPESTQIQILRASGATVSTSDALVTSTDSATCNAPPWPHPATVVVRLSLNGVTLLPTQAVIDCSSLKLTYLNLSAIDDSLTRTPGCGPSGGGTEIAISAAGVPLGWLGAPICRFGGSVEVAAMAATDGSLRCALPSSSDVSSVRGGVASVARLEIRLADELEWLPLPDVLYFSSATLTSSYPATGDAMGGDLLFIFGTGFLPPTDCAFEHQCRVGGVLGEVISANSSVLVCRTPVNTAGEVGVEISLNGNDFHAGPVTFTYVGLSPPTMHSARFSASGAQVHIDFGSQPTDMAGRSVGPTFRCDSLLTSESTARLGGADLIQCAWVSTSRLDILLSALSWDRGVVPVVGDALALRPNVLSPALSPGCPAAPSLCNSVDEIAISAAEQSAPPVAMTSVPAFISACLAELLLDGSGSTGAGIFPLSYTWQVSPDSPNAALINRHLLERAAASPYASVVSVPPSLLQGDATALRGAFEFRLAVRTHSGLISTPARADVTVAAHAPTIGIVAPTEVVRSVALEVFSSLEVGCEGVAAGVAWRWAVHDSSGADLASQIGLSDTALGLRDLRIPPNVLPYNLSVVFSFTAWHAEWPNEKATSTAAVVINQQGLLARITGGDARSASVSEPLVLDASSSADLDQLPGQLSFEWDCVAAAAAAQASCGGGLSSVPTYTTPAGALQPSAWYVFRVTVSKGTRKSEASVNVSTSATSAPVVRILGSFGVKASANASLRLRGSITSVAGGAVTPSWTVAILNSNNCSSADGSCPASQPHAALPASIPLGAANLVLPTPTTATTLLSPGATYVFTLSAAGADGARGYASVSLLVNRPPFGGSLKVAPDSGVACVDQFALAAAGWNDDDPSDLPLLFSFYLASASGEVSLREPSAKSSLFSTLPVAGQVSVFAIVRDQFGSSTRTPSAPLTLAWSPTASAEGFVQSMGEALMMRDMVGVQQAACSASALLTASDGDGTAVRTQLIGALDSCHDVSLSTATNVQTSASLIDQITSSTGELTSDSRVQAASLARSLAADALELSGADVTKSGSGSGSATSAATSGALFSTLSNVLDAPILPVAGQPTSRRLASSGGGASGGAEAALADVVGDATGQIARVLLSETITGETFTLRAKKLAMRVARQEPADLADATLSIGEEEEAAGRFVKFPMQGLLSGAAGGTDAPVDVQITGYTTNLRSYAASSATLCRGVACESGVASSLQTVKLRRGSEDLSVRDLPEPIQIGFDYTMPSSVNLSSTCDRNATDRCIQEHDAMLEEQVHVFQQCRAISRDMFWGWNNASGRYHACVQQLASMSAAAAEKNRSCAEDLPPPCNNNGVCTEEGVCVCNTGTLGGQCEVGPSCSFWNETSLSWSTDGCRTAPGSVHSNGSTNGRLVCEWYARAWA